MPDETTCVLMWCPWHRNRLLWPMTPDEAADRWMCVIERKRDEELWTRLQAFQPVQLVDRLPEEVQRAYQKIQRTTPSIDYLEWVHGLQEWESIVYRHWDALEAQRRQEYPDAPAYRRSTGLVFPDSYCAED